MSTASMAPVLVLGELDGMHRGHQRLIRAGTEFAHRFERRCDAVVFDVEERARVLTEPTERARGALALGASTCRVLRVPTDGVDADRLAHQILEMCKPAAIVMACAPAAVDDHRYPDLIAAFRARGVDVIEVERVHDEGGPVSSGRIRSALDEGDVGGATHLVGSAYTISGAVCHGQQLGRTIGFPTANLEPPTHRVLPINGVYAARVTLVDGRQVESAVNVGVRPTVEASGRTLVEAHLLDIDDDLYGQRIDISFVARIRGERRFDGLDALTVQLGRDVAATRSLLAMDSFRCGADW